MRMLMSWILGSPNGLGAVFAADHDAEDRIVGLAQSMFAAAHADEAGLQEQSTSAVFVCGGLQRDAILYLWGASLTISSRKRLAWRALRETSVMPSSCCPTPQERNIGRQMSCSRNGTGWLDRAQYVGVQHERLVLPFFVACLRGAMMFL